MSQIAIFQDSKQPGKCRSCGAAVTWVETVRNQKRMPLDGTEIVAVRTEGNPFSDRARVVEIIDTEITPSHFATCPDAEKWRRR